MALTLGERIVTHLRQPRVLEVTSIVRQHLLALLAKEPAHGYELKLALEQTFGAAYPSPNIGQIYVTLKRLEADGLVRSQDVAQTTRPNKRVYELTPVGREAALIAHTRTNAYLVFRENALGSLAPGKLADLVVLDRDYLAVPAAEIFRIKPVATMVGGKLVFGSLE